jgi:nitrogen regulatory protein PII-like uncharacterized protein
LACTKWKQLGNVGDSEGVIPLIATQSRRKIVLIAVMRESERDQIAAYVKQKIVRFEASVKLTT